MATLNDVERDPIDQMYLDLMKKFRSIPSGTLLLPKDVKKIILEIYENYNYEEEEEMQEEIQEDE
tara:strand:+ start:313 stop:507 length:195 start_codon:yes stop_codon:yes gene_type:complete